MCISGARGVSDRNARCGSLKVLVVEDDEDGAESMAMLLRLYGHDVQVARSGRVALESARADRPDVVLLDLGLPGMDGYDVARHLCESNHGEPPLLVAVTGYGGEDHRRRSAEAGIHVHLVKPVDPERLEDVLERFRT